MVPDPYSSQDFNRYMYVKGNPVKYSDPTGHMSFYAFMMQMRHLGYKYGPTIAKYARKGAKVGWKNIKAGAQFGARLASNIGNAGLSIVRWATRSPFKSLANKVKTIRVAMKASEVGRKFLKFTGDETVQHFNRHGKSIMKALAKSSYNLKDYIMDANQVIKSGHYVEALNGYIQIIGGLGRAKVLFVGLKNGGANISTFHIKTISELSKKVSWLNY